jgi:hypothetical protein
MEWLAKQERQCDSCRVQNSRPAPRFDPDRVAYFETEGWRAYYDRRKPALLRLILSLSHEQFQIPYPHAFLAAYYATRASLAWIPLNHDEAKVKSFYERFYRLARRYSGLSFDPATVAALELKYNDDHRRLVGIEDKSELLQTMTDLHAALFGCSEKQAADSAYWRVEALRTVDRITGGLSDDVERDWRTIEEQLRRCYRSVVGATGRGNVSAHPA